MDSNKNELLSAAESDIRAEKGLKELCAALAQVDDIQFIDDFFHCIFTPAELKDIGNRWLLVREIEKGTTQREIARMFQMSLCRITRGSKELKKSDSAFRRMFAVADKISKK